MPFPQWYQLMKLALEKNQHSFFNVRHLFDILYTPSKEVPECVVSLDAEKDFDRVEWNYWLTVLEKLRIGPTFITCIKLLYSYPSASILTNSSITTSWPSIYGTHQGCPLSPLLFKLAIEPLAIALHDCRSISGICMEAISCVSCILRRWPDTIYIWVQVKFTQKLAFSNQ